MIPQNRITDPHALGGMRVTVAEKSPTAPSRTFVGIVSDVQDGGRSLALTGVQELHFAGEEGGAIEIIKHAKKVIPLEDFDVLLCMEPL
jgi:hypothetical protein